MPARIAYEQSMTTPSALAESLHAEYLQSSKLKMFARYAGTSFLLLASMLVPGAKEVAAWTGAAQLGFLAQVGRSAVVSAGVFTAAAGSEVASGALSPTGKVDWIATGKTGLTAAVFHQFFATAAAGDRALAAMRTVRDAERVAAGFRARVQGGARDVAANVLRYPSRAAEKLVPHLPFKRPLSTGDKLTRFFVTATKGYARDTPVLRLLKRIPGVRALDWEQSHLVIQQQWFRSGGPSALFPEGSSEIFGLRALGQAGWNVMPLPSAVNQGLARSPWIMAGIGVAVEGGTAYGAYRTAKHAYDGGQKVVSGDWSESAEGK